jgi:hypothetical protein
MICPWLVERMASEHGMKIPMRTFKVGPCPKNSAAPYIKTGPNIATRQAGWPNGKALDYESRDCRFDPCVGHIFLLLSFLFALLLREGDMVRLDWGWLLIEKAGMLTVCL